MDLYAEETNLPINFLLCLKCIGAYCQLSNKATEQSFEVVTTVQFIDVSSTPETLLKPTPTFEAKAPSDFFYPFL